MITRNMTQVAVRKISQVEVQKFGILLMVISIILSFVYPLFNQQIIQLLERHFSNDHEITSNGLWEFISTYYFGIVLLFGIGYCFLKAKKASWRKRIREVILDEPLCLSDSVSPSPRLILIVSSLIGFLLILSMRLAYRFPFIYTFLYAKDHGLIDLCVPATMAISGILLIVVVWKLWKESRFIEHRAISSTAYSFLALLLIFYAGEETSWGQDFFGWQTPSLFLGNVEHQTNIHNYFNAYFNYGYIALSLILVVVIVSVWLEFNQQWLPYGRLFLPHPSLIGLSLLIAFVSVAWFPEQELLEEMVAAFVLFYCLRIFTCFRSESISIGASPAKNSSPAYCK